jgi:nitroreductase
LLLQEVIAIRSASDLAHRVTGDHDTAEMEEPRMFNDTSSMSALLATRRSGKARDMVAPGPDSAQMARILAAAIRVPDHGKLAPWRFIVIGPEQRDAFADLLHRAYRETRPEPGRQELASIEEFARQAPALVVVVSCSDPASAIPVWEQELSAGAACMNLLAAAHAEGFVGSWLTGWAAYSDTVRAAFASRGKIAGFIYLGTAGRELQERPRPDYDAVVSNWSPSA